MEIIERKDMLYFDLETTGLEPHEDQLRAYGLLDTETGEIEIKTANRTSRERDLLGELISLLLLTPEWGGWNITEFDLRFINVRAQIHGLNFPVQIVDEEPVYGKYGSIRLTVPNRRIDDLCYGLGAKLADELEVKWGLHSVAGAFGWKPTVEIKGDEFVNVPLPKLVKHLVDDLEAIHTVIKGGSK